MASSMSPELQKTFENTWAYEMNQQLKEMFQAKASKERLDVVKSLMACKPKPEASICTFVLEMKGYFDRLESLNMVFDAKLSINIILSGLPADYNLVVPRKAAQGKSDRGSKRKAEFEIAPTSDPKEAMCFYCNTNRHWKRSCPNYLKDFKDGKVKKGSHSGSKGSRMLKHGKLNLVMENRKIKPIQGLEKYEAHAKDWTSPCKDIYEFVECISHNGNVILNVVSSNELDKSKLCPRYSRIGHVNKIRIAQLQKDGVLESFDFKSDDVCESCLLDKMTKSPFTGSCEREAQDKLEARSEKCLFVGYPEESFGYLFYRPKDNVVFVARRGTFLEREMISKEDNGSKIDLEEIQETSSRVRKPPLFYYGFHIEEDKISDSILSELNKPANYKEAMASPMAAKIMLAIAMFHDYEIWQMDVKNAFLNGKLTEDVFMAQPEGFENAKYPKRVCKL
ncbi:retrotransposon protein, putative, ty1-copia subclass [Tanacetum coccineum]